MKQDKRTRVKLDFGCIQKVRECIERKHGLEVAEAASQIVHTATKMCALNAIANKVDPAKTLVGVIEMFKAVDRSSDVLAHIRKTGKS
jgi:hypothetical protein